MISEELIIAQTQKWIKSVVVDLNFCPFAAKAVLQKTINYSVLHEATDDTVLANFETELKKLDADLTSETAFIILPDGYSDFEDYLDLVSYVEEKLEVLNYEGVYQVASFHPEYCFEGEDKDDASNYTNRSPYPMLHLLREASITKALTTFKHPELIPETNITLTREKGLKYMQVLRQACFEI